VRVVRRFAALSSWALLLASLPCFPAIADMVRIDCVAQREVFALPSKDGERVFESAGGWLEIEEIGQLLVLPGAESSAIRISQPRRYGRYWLDTHPGQKIALRRGEPNEAAGAVALTAHCDLAARNRAQLDWLTKLAGIDAQIDSPEDAAGVLRLLPALDELQRSATDPHANALIDHYRAMTFLAANQGRRAAEAFAESERGWILAAEPNYAAAARVGRVEAFYEGGDDAAVLRDTERFAGAAAPSTYFDARLLNARCLVLHRSGKYADAERCYNRALAALATLDERNESASVMRNLATLQRVQGKLASARALASSALALTAGPNAVMTRGRLHLLLAVLDQQAGDVVASIRHIDLANREFEQAGSGALFWRASSRLNEAILFGQIGAWYEAYGALSEVNAFLPSQHSLALRARVFADLEAQTQHFDSALFWYGLAEDRYASEGASPARDWTRLARLRLAAQRQSHSAAAATVQEIRELPPLYEGQRQILTAMLALKRGDLVEARSAAERAWSRPLPLADQVALADVDAEIRLRSGDVEAGLMALTGAKEQIRLLAGRAGNGVLGQTIERLAVPLRRKALGYLIGSPITPLPTASVEAIAPWLVLGQGDIAVDRDAGTPRGDGSVFDRAVAAELLATEPGARAAAESATHRSMLALLTSENNSTNGMAVAVRQSPALTLTHLQAALSDGDVLAAYLDGGTRGALLWVTRSSAALIPAADADEVRAKTATLRELLRVPTSSLTAAEAAAGGLSDALLHEVPGAPPRRLWIVADELSDGIPWAMLRWPGRDAPLIESTTTVLARVLGARESVAAKRSSVSVHVLAAAQLKAGEISLPNLTNAAVEAQQIRDALVPAGMHIDANMSATRDAVFDSLHDRDAFVHIAAHGMAQPPRIGYAGVWLEPSAGETMPSFLSWLDILDAGVRADLVVLNACQLGDSGTAVNGNLSFASAVARAGARRVVASLWPVSDSATVLWVPAFYSALRDNPGDAAAALRRAQLHLAHSRAFAHPFFWAGMQAIERLDVVTEELPAKPPAVRRVP